MNYKLTRYESETNITLNNLEQKATLYTCQRIMIKRLDRLCKKYPEYFKLIRQDEYSKTYEFDKKFVFIKQPRILSDEQKERMRAVVKKARENNPKLKW